MAGLIKKQILKHLSRFAKNLSPDKINLSTLKGEGQLTNLELDEDVLQSLLDLPTWLAIRRVECNKAAIRIPWTKLKTHPISLTLDKVVMEMSTCDEPRPPNGPSPLATPSGQSEYGFAEKVVEGMSLSINSIVIRISAKAFNASFELSQLQVYSVNTSWSVSDLRFTRIHDPQRGEVLTFKEISWQMIRIEADAIQSAEHDMLSAPIRLITNQSKIRVTLKRRVKDCNVVASKLILILDDLLWVLTDSQLKAMVQYAKSLSEAMDRSAQQRKSRAPEDQVSPTPPSAQQVRTQQASTAADQSATMAKLFSAYDVCETSHHLQITHLDLHICDDLHATDKAINKRIMGGAMQLSFSSITLDYYPFHRAGDSCVHWMHYSEATKTREVWVRSLLDEFRANVDLLKTTVRDQQGPGPGGGSPQHGKISTSASSVSPPPPPHGPRAQLMSSSVVLRMADFTVYQVSLAEQRRCSPAPMLSCNKKALYLPADMPALHLEVTEYYYPDGTERPVPCPNLYVQLNALQLVLDPRSLVWINLFGLDLRQSLEQFMEVYKLNDSQKPDEHVDVKVDGLMLKVVIPSDRDASAPPDLPRSLSVQTSEMVATNTRQPAQCGRGQLGALLQAFQEEPFFCSASFPRSASSPPVLHPAFRRHAHERDTRLHDVYRGLAALGAAADALKTPAAADFWALHFAQFWVDYEGGRGGRGRPQPCVDSFPLAVWACQPAKLARLQEARRGAAEGGAGGVAGGGLSRSASAEALGRLQRKRLLKEYYSSDGAPSPPPPPPPSNGLLDGPPPPAAAAQDPDVHVLVHVQKPVSAQVSHRQYQFLMQLQRSVKTLQQTLQQDLEDMGSRRDRTDPGEGPAGPPRPFTVCLGLLLQSAEVSLLLRPVPEPRGSGSPPGSDLSPSESRGTLEPGGEAGDGAPGGSEGSGPDGVKRPSAADRLPCRDGSESGVPPGPSPPVLTSSTEERTPSGTPGRGGSEDGGEAPEDKLPGGDDPGPGPGPGPDPRAQLSDPLCDGDKDKPAKMQQSVSSGRLMRDRSQSSFSVSYKNMKKSPSLQSLDNVSIDSYLLEDGDAGDTYSLLERDDVSISGFKDAVSEQSAAEALAAPEPEGAASPDTVSAASQSLDEPGKDTVSVLVLKVQSVCVSMEAVGDSSVVALEVDRVTPTQLGNVSLRQYLSNRSLGGAGPAPSSARGLRRPEVRARLESGPCAAARSPLAERNGFLQLRLHGYRAGLLTSTLQNLAHFLEDDSAPQVLPMEISVRDSQVHLQDDGSRDNPSDPEPSPVSLHVDSLLVLRRDDGSFCIGDSTPRKSVSSTDSSALSPVRETVGGACGVPKATQTEAPPTSPPPSGRETALMEENECLKVELSRAKMALAEAQMEKDSLLHQMKSLKLSSST
ncbi:bridge-like lipid transfer protein family member 3B isoform X2 [Salarias fasciatus]|uniref:Uncharacterized protein n=1 Tax=Salarias fasciatus TaxID=181472 RepID=A0A672I8E0_SALFA|nr:UHRF1-binding protein 1-like isoform X2 [Salarias fasciatus]